MGVTIHYVGQLQKGSSTDELFATAKLAAQKMGWQFEQIQNLDGPFTSGFVVFPHRNCEPLRVEFGTNLRFRDWVKTQFAGPDIHIQVIGFLKEIRPCLRRFCAFDEGEYWETGSDVTLRSHFEQIDTLLQEMKEENPGIQINVREPSGRIIDVIG